MSRFLGQAGAGHWKDDAVRTWAQLIADCDRLLADERDPRVRQAGARVRWQLVEAHRRAVARWLRLRGRSGGAP